MQYKARTEVIDDISITFMLANFNHGNTQEGLLAITDKNGYMGMANVPNICVMVGQQDMHSLFAVAEELYLRLAGGEGANKKTIVCSDENVKVQAKMDAEDGEYSVKIYFLNNKPAFTTHGIDTSWKHRVKGTWEIKGILKSIYTAGKGGWTHRGDLIQYNGSSPGDLSNSQFSIIHGYHSIPIIKQQLEFLRNASLAYETGSTHAEKVLRELFCKQLSRLSFWYEVATCRACKKEFLRAGSEPWKKACLDCWRSDGSS